MWAESSNELYQHFVMAVAVADQDCPTPHPLQLHSTPSGWRIESLSGENRIVSLYKEHIHLLPLHGLELCPMTSLTTSGETGCWEWRDFPTPSDFISMGHRIKGRAYTPCDFTIDVGSCNIVYHPNLNQKSGNDRAGNGKSHQMHQL